MSTLTSKLCLSSADCSGNGTKQLKRHHRTHPAGVRECLMWEESPHIWGTEVLGQRREEKGSSLYIQCYSQKVPNTRGKANALTPLYLDRNRRSSLQRCFQPKPCSPGKLCLSTSKPFKPRADRTQHSTDIPSAHQLIFSFHRIQPQGFNF